MLTDNQIWRLTRMSDVCLTNIVRDKTYNANEFNTRKFSEIIDQERFEYVHDIAYEIYCILTENGLFLPTITAYDHCCLKIEYSNYVEEQDKRIITIWLEPNKKTQYALDTGAILELPTPDILQDTLMLFCEFLNYTSTHP